MDCGHGWRNDADCDICRPPAIVVAGLRGRISDLEAALRPFADCVFDDNGDVTLDRSRLRFDDWLRARNALR